MHNESPRSLHLIHKKTVSKMALKTPLHFTWAFPTSSKRTALGQTRPRQEKDLSGGLARPPGILCNPPVSADRRGPLESVVPCPTTQVTCRGGGWRRKVPLPPPAPAQHLAPPDL